VEYVWDAIIFCDKFEIVRQILGQKGKFIDKQKRIKNDSKDS
jgi:hypothetical protein